MDAAAVSVLLNRHLPLGSCTLETYVSMDGQGKPSYETGVTMRAWVVWEGSSAAMTDGTKVATLATLYVPSSQPTPNVDDRVKVDGESLIVVDTKPPRRLQTGVVDHTQVKCRRE